MQWLSCRPVLIEGQVFSRHLFLPLEEPTVLAPVAVPNLPGVARAIAAGGQHSAVILRRGRLFLAGDNRSGQLGQSRKDVDWTSTFFELPFQDYTLRVRALVFAWFFLNHKVVACCCFPFVCAFERLRWFPIWGQHDCFKHDGDPPANAWHVQIEHRTYMINVCMHWFVFFFTCFSG